MGLNLAASLTETAARAPERVAVRLGETALTYAALDERSARLASLLRDRGLAAGDRVGVMLPNVPEFAIAYYGVLRAGGIVVPMNVLLKRREIAFYLEDSGAGILLAWHGFADEARAGAATAGVELIEIEPAAFAELLAGAEPNRELAETEPEDTAVILYTSGTTGRPKGAELTHFNLSRNAEIASRTTCEVADGDVVLGALPLFHSFGQTVGMNASVRVGATLTLVPKFDPGEALATIGRDRVTHFYGVPTMFGALLHHPARAETDTSSLRTCVTGGAAMPVEVLRGFEEAFECVVLEGYGLSETSPVASSNHPGMERKPGSIGTPLEDVEMKVVDENDEEVPQGEVIASDPKPGTKILRHATITLTISLGKERYKVPQLVGLTEDKAQDRILAHHLAFGKSTRVFSEKVPRGRVISSSPRQGIKLKRDSVVDLVVSKGRKPINFADWTGKDAATAKKALEAKGLVVDISNEEYSDTVPAGSVIAQDPRQGPLFRGDKVTLVVSKGPEMVTIPTDGIIAAGVEAATAKLEGLGFVVKTKKADGYLGLGFVQSTDPAPGTSVPKGSTITLFLI